MRRIVRWLSLLIVVGCFLIVLLLESCSIYDKFSQNKIIDSIYVKSIVENKDYLGYIYIPKYDLKRLIKDGTSDAVLDSNYVGVHELSSGLESDDYLILAGHNVKSVFACLHRLAIGDVVYIINESINREFIVYDKKYVNEYEMKYLYNGFKNELLLITCSNKNGERLLVMLREVL